jgi:hypothetical protein
LQRRSISIIHFWCADGERVVFVEFHPRIVPLQNTVSAGRY